MRIKQVKYAAPAATIVLAAIAALLFILLVNNDADSSDSPVPAASPTVPIQPTEPPPTIDVLTPLAEASATAAAATAEAQPTATAAPSATSVPQSTATAPAPTTVLPTPTRPPLPTAVPSATPLPPISVRAFADPDPASALPIPNEINPDLEPQSSQVVVDAWTKHFDGSLVRISGDLPAEESGGAIGIDFDQGNLDLAFCENGHGVILGVSRLQNPDEVGEVFTWSFKSSPAGRWYAPNLTVQMLNSNLSPLLDMPQNSNGLVPGEPRTFAFTVVDERIMTFLFDTFVHDASVVAEVCNQIPA